jgi:alpha-tubulin suppressor-like RCC1 family protein
LGFGHNTVTNEPQIANQLCDQQIIDFANGLYHCIARNSSGKVYFWGCNNVWGLLGIGSKDNHYHKPVLNQYLKDEFVIEIRCGAYHSLVLTNSGRVYAWSANYFGQIGNGCNKNQLTSIKLNGFNGERVVMISCGFVHSMALTECGHVYGWGYKGFGQLGNGNTINSNEPKFILVTDQNKCNYFIEKINCGIHHSLLLSSDGYIYVFGRNQFGELGNQKEENELSPYKINTETKFIDISSHWTKSNDISIVLSLKGIYYNWGKCEEEIIRTPKETNIKSFLEIYVKYLKITHKAIDFELRHKTPIQIQNEFSKQNLISCGGFGIISKVLNKKIGKIYAVKKLH